MGKSPIEWTDDTWNPMSGCTKITAGCAHCYAESVANRYRGKAFPNGFQPTLKPHKLAEPVTWRKPRKIFVNSMSDIFHERFPFEYIAAVFGTMAAAPRHTFQVLTKRPERMLEFFEWYEQSRKPRKIRNRELIRHAALVACNANQFGVESRLLGALDTLPPDNTWPLPNVWVGVTVESTKYLDRLDQLRRTPAAIRFVSMEPLLAPINQSRLEDALRDIDWVILGGESGPKARPCFPVWIHQCMDAAKSAGCAVFVKQMGSTWAKLHGSKHPAGGLPEEWNPELKIREFPGVAR